MDKIAHAYEPWDRITHKFPCAADDAPDTEGIFYIKIPKTSSSTLAKITKRIAGREARRQYKEGTCKVYEPMVHQRALDLKVGERKKEKSFLWTVVRHPAMRMISHYGMNIAFGDVEASESAFIERIKRWTPNMHLYYLTTNPDISLETTGEIASNVQSILNEYNFIGVYERLYESLVVLSMLIGVEVTDVLFDFIPSTHSRCGSLTQPDWLTEGMENYLQNEFAERASADFVLYDAANKSLDMTIEKLGREKVEKKLQEYEQLLNIGTNYWTQQTGSKGCGIPRLHPNHQPYDDIDELPWYGKLSPDDQALVKKLSYGTSFGWW
jgi:hypothetical protein